MKNIFLERQSSSNQYERANSLGLIQKQDKFQRGSDIKSTIKMKKQVSQFQNEYKRQIALNSLEKKQIPPQRFLFEKSKKYQSINSMFFLKKRDPESNHVYQRSNSLKQRYSQMDVDSYINEIFKLGKKKMLGFKNFGQRKKSLKFQVKRQSQETPEQWNENSRHKNRLTKNNFCIIEAKNEESSEHSEQTKNRRKFNNNLLLPLTKIKNRQQNDNILISNLTKIDENYDLECLSPIRIQKSFLSIAQSLTMCKDQKKNTLNQQESQILERGNLFSFDQEKILIKSKQIQKQINFLKKQKKQLQECVSEFQNQFIQKFNDVMKNSSSFKKSQLGSQVKKLKIFRKRSFDTTTQDITRRFSKLKVPEEKSPYFKKSKQVADMIRSEHQHKYPSKKYIRTDLQAEIQYSEEYHQDPNFFETTSSVAPIKMGRIVSQKKNIQKLNYPKNQLIEDKEMNTLDLKSGKKGQLSYKGKDMGIQEEQKINEEFYEDKEKDVSILDIESVRQEISNTSEIENINIHESKIKKQEKSLIKIKIKLAQMKNMFQPRKQVII